MFQLVLTESLRSHLSDVSATGNLEQQPLLCDAKTRRMAHMAGYSQSAEADNVKIFHGREVRQVKNAEGGMGMVLQLSLAKGHDPEGWTPQEISEYNGWTHDSQRRWRQGELLEEEGYRTFRRQFGSSAFTLHHRFYLHLDEQNQMWLSAEDGCEGHPAVPRRSFVNKALDPFRGRP